MQIQSINDSLQRWGLCRTLFAGFYRRVLRKVGVHLHHIHMRELAEPDAPIIFSLGLAFRQTSVAELQSASKDPALHIEASFIAKALQRGDLCIGAYDGETLVAYAWRAFRVATHQDGVTIAVRAPYCYTYKVFTRAEYRGQGIWPTLTHVSDQECLARSCNRMIGFIEVDNFASLRAAEKLGAVYVGYAGFVRCLGRNFTFHSRGVKQTGFRFIA